MYRGLNGMAELPVISMQTGGLLWFTDLTVQDPFYALPLMTVATLFITIEVGFCYVVISDYHLTLFYVVISNYVVSLTEDEEFKHFLCCQLFTISHYFEYICIAFLLKSVWSCRNVEVIWYELGCLFTWWK